MNFNPILKIDINLDHSFYYDLLIQFISMIFNMYFYDYYIQYLIVLNHYFEGFFQFINLIVNYLSRNFKPMQLSSYFVSFLYFLIYLFYFIILIINSHHLYCRRGWSILKLFLYLYPFIIIHQNHFSFINFILQIIINFQILYIDFIILTASNSIEIEFFLLLYLLCVFCNNLYSFNIFILYIENLLYFLIFLIIFSFFIKIMYGFIVF